MFIPIESTEALKQLSGMLLDELRAKSSLDDTREHLAGCPVIKTENVEVAEFEDPESGWHVLVLGRVSCRHGFSTIPVVHRQMRYQDLIEEGGD